MVTIWSRTQPHGWETGNKADSPSASSQSSGAHKGTRGLPDASAETLRLLAALTERVLDLDMCEEDTSALLTATITKFRRCVQELEGN